MHAAAAACTVPTIADPGVIAPASGHGRVPSTDVAPSAGCVDDGRSMSAGRNLVRLEVGSLERTAVVDVPVTDPDDPRPLLVSLHPFLFGADAWETCSGLATAGTARGYLVVTPAGIEPGPRWAVPGGLDTGLDDGSYDLAFIAALVDHVEDRACVDRNRVFAAGFSAGAAMA